jgi:hypothetical protein
MKKILFISVAFLIFSSCKDDTTPTVNNKTGQTNILLEGIWNLADVKQQNGKMSTDGQSIATFTAQSSNETGTVEFKSDGTFKSSVGYTSTMTMVITGFPEQEIESIIPPTVTTGTWTYDDSANEVSMTNIGDSTVLTASVLELTSTKFVYLYPVYQTETQDGVKSETWVDVVTTFTR